jgi:dihydrofolate reductase
VLPAKRAVSLRFDDSWQRDVSPQLRFGISVAPIALLRSFRLIRLAFVVLGDLPEPVQTTKRRPCSGGACVDVETAGPAPIISCRRAGGAEGAEEVVMSKVVLDVSMSLDGFIAGPNVREAEPMGDDGERLHAWMAGNGPDAQIDIGVRREVDATVGATVIGRRTFDLGVGPWGGTPWPGMPSFVVTHRTRPDLLGKNGGVFAFDGLEAAARRAKQAAGHKDVLVLGADVARQLLRAGLLDELRIHLVPLLLGAGTPLFDGEPAELIPEGKPVTGTVTHLRFRVGTA